MKPVLELLHELNEAYAAVEALTRVEVELKDARRNMRRVRRNIKAIDAEIARMNRAKADLLVELQEADAEVDSLTEKVGTLVRPDIGAIQARFRDEIAEEGCYAILDL
jgi:chromosome segregation ATPase